LKKLSFIKEDDMFKPRSRKRRKNFTSSAWKKAKNLILAKPGALRETPLPMPETDNADWLVCPHDTTIGLGVHRKAEKNNTGKTSASIF
jgi:hypothetical protein